MTVESTLTEGVSLRDRVQAFTTTACDGARR